MAAGAVMAAFRASLPILSAAGPAPPWSSSADRCAGATLQWGQQTSSRYQARIGTGEVVRVRLTMMGIDENELAWRLKHEGIRAGEIVAYRAWRVIAPRWFRDGDDRLHSVYMRDYVWHPGEPASGDVRTHGIYSFRDAVRSREEYRYYAHDGPLLFGMIKIWGEVVEQRAQKWHPANDAHR